MLGYATMHILCKLPNFKTILVLYSIGGFVGYSIGKKNIVTDILTRLYFIKDSEETYNDYK